MLLFIGLTVMAFGAFAEKVPSVVVNKYNGGWTAIFNLYNYVCFTPAESSPTGVGQLDCSGGGFTACRIPNCTSLDVNSGNSVLHITEAGKLASFQQAINDVIVQYETAVEQSLSASASNNSSKGLSVPTTYSKTIALSTGSSSSASGKKKETYVVRGVVTESNATSSTMKIYIEKVDLFAVAGSN